ncbi:MAG: glycosyltransferase family 4 protein [Gammaproteobacteria bacterium]|nr:glycosyltransferase family 4 protein [Gammaproteobacteria bacterium]MCP5136681.1 glycosyltransferase family 4 protein [Gammaproteobacteria bacterium]
MRIGISAFAGDGGKSGISQYMINIFKRLPAQAPDDDFVLFMTHADRAFFTIDDPRVQVVSYPDWMGHPIVSILWHLLWLPFALMRAGCEVCWMPAGNRRLAWWYGVPSVSTIHDMSQLHVPAKYDAFRMFYIMRVLPMMMRRLTRVLSISISTERDLIDYCRVDPARIRVVYNGADLNRFSPRDREQAKAHVSAASPIPHDYLLYISRLEHPGKNHVGLIEAFAKLKANSALPHKLVLVGSRWNGAEAIDAAVRQHGLEDDVIFPGFLPNEVLPDLMSGADLFVFPSLFEGFGIPPLEAMTAGTPVVASNRSSIPEVVGDAGILVDPTDTSAMAEAMQRVLTEPDLAEDLVRKGLEQAKRFSWEDATRGVIELCHEVHTAR